MLEYDRIDVSQGIDANKTNASTEWDICHYWYFLDKGFKYETYLSSCCHDLMQKAMNFNDIVIVSVKISDYRIHFWYRSKDDAINIMKNSDLNEKKRIVINFLLYIKMSETNTYYQRNREIILNRVKDYYKINKDKIRDQARNRYIELSQEENSIKREYGRNRYHNVSEENKQRLKEYQKNCH